MDYLAELKYTSTGELAMTGQSDGKGEPSYVFPDDMDFDVEVHLLDILQESYDTGLYGTGSPGEVRDMVFAMERVVEAHEPLYKLVIPRDTQAKIDKEAKRDQKVIDDDSVF